MKNKKIIANIFICIGVICVLSALGLAIANEYENRNSYLKSQNVIEQMMDAIDSKVEGSELENESDVQKLQDFYYDMPTKNIDGVDYIGYLGLDTLDMQFPIISDWDYTKLRIAPCRYTGSLQDHNLVIAGHNYRDGFRMLKQLNEGDYLYFMTMNGVIHRYQVGAIEVIEPTGIDEMINSKWDLSLYTCTYEGKMRFTIRCNEIY